jgi:hypothetical protein
MVDPMARKRMNAAPAARGVRHRTSSSIPSHRTLPYPEQ